MLANTILEYPKLVLSILTQKRKSPQIIKSLFFLCEISTDYQLITKVQVKIIPQNACFILERQLPLQSFLKKQSRKGVNF